MGTTQLHQPLWKRLPAGKTNRIGLQVLDYRGRDDDALRWVRPQCDLGAHHRRFL
jgi:hypothetical protein